MCTCVCMCVCVNCVVGISINFQALLHVTSTLQLNVIWSVRMVITVHHPIPVAVLQVGQVQPIIATATKSSHEGKII